MLLQSQCLCGWRYHLAALHTSFRRQPQIRLRDSTGTESKETLDEFIEAMRTVAREAIDDPEMVKSAPHVTPVRRLDETTAAKNPILRFKDLNY